MAMARAKFRVEADDKSSAQVRGIQRRFQDLGRTAMTIQGPLGGVAQRLSSIGASFGRVGPVGLAAAGAVSLFGVATSKAARAGAALEQQQGRIAALIKATGQSAGLTAAEIDKMARDLGLSTLTTAAAAREAAGILLTFKSITGDTFERALKLSQDLAAAMGTDLRSATVQVGKALEDPARGLSSLRESGVSFTTAQQAMIKSMLEAGQQAQAQGAILDTLRDQVGGAGAGAAQGLTGSVDSLTEHWTAFLEELDRTTGASSTAQSALDALSAGIERMKSALQDSRSADAGELEARRLALTQRIAHFEEKIANAQHLTPKVLAMMNEELQIAREQLAAISSELDVAGELAGMEESMAAVRAETQAMAAARAEEQARTEDASETWAKYEKRLAEVRKSLGSSVLKSQEQAAQLKLLEFAYESGSIALAEYIELKRKLLDVEERAAAAQRAQGGVLDFFPGFVAPTAQGGQSNAMANPFGEMARAATAAADAASERFLNAAPLSGRSSKWENDSLRALNQIAKKVSAPAPPAVALTS